MAEIAVGVIWTLISNIQDIDVELITYVGKVNGKMEDTIGLLVKDVLIDKDFSHPQMPNIEHRGLFKNTILSFYPGIVFTPYFSK